MGFPYCHCQEKGRFTKILCGLQKAKFGNKERCVPSPTHKWNIRYPSGSQWFSTFGLLSGYWLAEVAEENGEKTAFSMQSGLFEFKVMPFGLCNALSTFQRLMDLVLAGVQWSHCLVYLNDIEVGRSFNNHLQNLDIILQWLREANLRLKPAKCSFCKIQEAFRTHHF